MSDQAKREPFCWLEKRKLRMIADVFAEGKLGAVSAARTVYLALSEIASDKQKDTFTVATLYIAQRAGVTPKTVRRMTKTFKRLGFLKIRPRSQNGLKLSSEYTLIRGYCSMRPIYPSLGKARKNAFPTREECNEESTERTARKEKEILSGNDDIITHARTGERFNQRTKEFDW
jgi:DNA-binding IscR family transcriptional regulator